MQVAADVAHNIPFAREMEYVWLLVSKVFGRSKDGLDRIFRGKFGREESLDDGVEILGFHELGELSLYDLLFCFEI
jgi:hypothetical protein